MRQRKLPSLQQWGCAHEWKTTHSLPQKDALHRIRHHKCRRCGLRVKTEERPVVLWDEADLLAQVKALLPEGQAVALGDQGISELPLARLNARLSAQGYVIGATKGSDLLRLVACTDDAGQVEWFGVFELRRISPEASRRAPGKRRHGNSLPQPIGTQSDRKKGRADETLVLTGDDLTE
jgi:hypothetical protein